MRKAGLIILAAAAVFLAVGLGVSQLVGGSDASPREQSAGADAPGSAQPLADSDADKEVAPLAPAALQPDETYSRESAAGLPPGIAEGGVADVPAGAGG